MGFNTEALPSDLYLIDELKSSMSIVLEGFDIDNVNLGNGSFCFIPKYRTILEPKAY